MTALSRCILAIMRAARNITTEHATAALFIVLVTIGVWAGFRVGANMKLSGKRCRTVGGEPIMLTKEMKVLCIKDGLLIAIPRGRP